MPWPGSRKHPRFASRRSPPERGVIVEHQYRPSVGTSSDTILRRILRSNKSLSPEVERYRKDYCVSDAFLAQLDERAGNGALNAPMIQQRRIHDALNPAANWPRPIRSFTLTIHPRDPDLALDDYRGDQRFDAELRTRCRGVHLAAIRHHHQFGNALGEIVDGAVQRLATLPFTGVAIHARCPRLVAAVLAQEFDRRT